MTDPQKEWVDQSITYSENGRPITITPADLLVKAARMQRDGMSLRAIRKELDLFSDIDDSTLQRALNRGAQILHKRIAAGTEQAETKILVDKNNLPLSTNDTEPTDD